VSSLLPCLRKLSMFFRTNQIWTKSALILMSPYASRTKLVYNVHAEHSCKSSELLNRPDVQLILYILFLWFTQLKNMMLDDDRAVIYNVQKLCTFALNLATWCTHVVDVVSLGFIWTIPVYFDEPRYKIRFNFRCKVSYVV
jgi:hypothetical protein